MLGFPLVVSATISPLIEDCTSVMSAISVQLLSGLFPLSRKEQWREMNLGDITENFNRRNKDRSSYPMYSVTNTSGFSPQNEIFDGKEIKDEDISIYKIIEKGEFARSPAQLCHSLHRKQLRLQNSKCTIGAFQHQYHPKSLCASQYGTEKTLHSESL